MTRNKLLVGTSANLSSHHPFVDIQELESSNLHGYDALVDGGVLNNSLNAVSTIADLVEVGNPKIIREGLIPRERIFTVLKGL
jgi:tRNA A37 threonylcarbamoyladenosine synthetase subunit TsaC/SUA5/YrdC